MASPKTVYALTLEPEACCLVRGQRSGRRVLTQVQAQSTSAHDLDFRTAVKSAELDVESGECCVGDVHAWRIEFAALDSCSVQFDKKIE